MAEPGRKVSGTQPRHPWLEQLRIALWACAHLALLVWVTVQISGWLHAPGNGRVAGNREMLLAGVWAAYGLLLFLWGDRFSSRPARLGARFLLAAALSYLMLGALMANGRWALPLFRASAYLLVLAGIWLVEWLGRHHAEEAELQGLLGHAALLCGAWTVGFEALRWTEPLLTLPDGHWPTAQWLRWGDGVRAYAMGGGLGLYALATMAAGVRISSARTRVLAAALFALALGALLQHGLPGLQAPWPLRLFAFAALVPGAGLAGWMGLQAEEAPQTRTWLTMKVLAVGAMLLGTAWLSYEVAAVLP